MNVVSCLHCAVVQFVMPPAISVLNHPPCPSCGSVDKYMAIGAIEMPDAE